MSSAIAARGVSKRYRLAQDGAHSLKEAVVRRGRRRDIEEFWALRDVDLEIARGSFHGLIGHNGSGKSTLLKLLAGIHRPTRGEVVVDGRVSALLELGSGFHPELTGRENIYLNGAILGLNRKQMDAAIDEIIEFSDIGDFIDAPVKILSSGMYVRLGFAVAVHVDPEILLVDEVIAVGDEEFQRKCLDHLYELRRRGVTIVLVSHSISLVESLCDEVGWLDHGELQQVGTPGEVCNAYLDAVNQIEFEKAEAQQAAQAELGNDELAPESEPGPVVIGEGERIPVNDEGVRRRGSGEIRLEGLQFYDQHGNPFPIASCGDPLRIRIWHRATETVASPVISVSVQHPNGITLAAPTTASAGVELGEVAPGVAFVDLIMDRVPLLPGDYSLNFEIRDSSQTHVFDAWEHAEILRVQPGTSRERSGIVDVAARWEVGEG